MHLCLKPSGVNSLTSLSSLRESNRPSLRSVPWSSPAPNLTLYRPLCRPSPTLRTIRTTLNITSNHIPVSDIDLSAVLLHAPCSQKRLLDNLLSRIYLLLQSRPGPAFICYSTCSNTPPYFNDSLHVACFTTTACPVRSNFSKPAVALASELSVAASRDRPGTCRADPAVPLICTPPNHTITGPTSRTSPKAQLFNASSDHAVRPPRVARLWLWS